MKKTLLLLIAVLFVISTRADKELPLKVVQAPKTVQNAPVFFLISGDGGWNQFTDQLARNIAARGYNLVGLDARQYFWEKKDKNATVKVINDVISASMTRFKSKNYVLAGFSFGACIVPFIASASGANTYLSPDALVLISPDKTGEFEIHLADMLSFSKREGKYQVIPELQKLKALEPIVIFGKEEDGNTILAFKHAGLNVMELPGNHHYDNKVPQLAARICIAVKEKKL